MYFTETILNEDLCRGLYIHHLYCVTNHFGLVVLKKQAFKFSANQKLKLPMVITFLAGSIENIFVGDHIHHLYL